MTPNDCLQELTVPQSAMLHIRLDRETKAQATEALAAMGLSVSDAVRILLKRVVHDQVRTLQGPCRRQATRVSICMKPCAQSVLIPDLW